MLKPNTFEIDPAAVAKEAHRIARIYASVVGYRTAFAWGMRDGWRHARLALSIAIERSEQPPEVLAIRDEMVAIQCRSRITDRDRAELKRLRRELLAAELRGSIQALAA